MTTILSKNDLNGLIQALRTAFRSISSLRTSDNLASLVQNPKIPPALSESLAFHLIQDEVILPDLNSLRAGARSESDIVAKDSHGRSIAIEVKGTGTSAWVFMGPKDYKANYLVWLLFGDFFADPEQSTIRICVADPAFIHPMRDRITIGALIQLAGERLLWTDINLIAYSSEQKSERNTSTPLTTTIPTLRTRQREHTTRPKGDSKLKPEHEGYTPRMNSGANLNDIWRVGAADCRFHREGKFFMPVTRFPAAFFDPSGYLLFRTKAEYQQSPYLNIGGRVNVPGGIAGVPGYKRMVD